jgi:metallo-beta-lactamase family protein
VIRIPLCGAAGEVTGSGYLVETPRSTVLVDFGVFQGGREARTRSRELGPVDPGRLNAAILTHAHIDHSGRLPRLYAQGYRGSVCATRATLALTPILLEDLARLDLEWVAKLNRARQRAGKDLFAPIYTPEDVKRMHQRVRALGYGGPQEIAAGVAARFHEAGHIMGSASIELIVEDGDAEKVIVFSGDIGPKGVPILRDPEPPTRADVVFLESTYGGRERVPQAETVKAFKDILETAAERSERVLIPAFAVGRSQLILYYLAEAVREGRLPRDFPIILDSPMAAKATEALIRHPEVLDDEATELASRRQFSADLQSLRVVQSARESKALNDSDEPCVILSASGMCEGGRIVHHLRHNLWRPKVNVVLVGYMVEGSLGRQLADGEPAVEIFGEEVVVRARVHLLDGFSAHADQAGLLEWLGPMATQGGSRRPRVILTHGEDPAREALAAAIKRRFDLVAELPQRGAVIQIQ